MNFLKYLILLLALSSQVWSAPLPEAALKKLDNDLRYLISQATYAELSIAVVDRHGVISQVRGNQAYPLASVFKLPLLLAILDGQDQGTFPSMTSTLTLSTSDQCIGSGQLANLGVGAQVTVDKACRLMMSISDNTGTDVLFRRLGCKNLDPWLLAKGFKSSEILLTNRQAWLLSLGKVPGWGATTPEARVQRWTKLDRQAKLGLAQKIEEAYRSLTIGQFQAIEDASTGTQSAYQDNLLAARLDNKMSALDLANLLVALDKGTLLTEKSTDKAFQIVAGQKYHSRLPKSLSASTEIFHKTGTLSGIQNDAGILYVKNRKEGVAVVFLSQNISPGYSSQVDRLASQVAKLVEGTYSRY